MADSRLSAPQNFQASKASAAPGDSITFTWNPSTAQSGVTIDYYQLTGFNPVTGQYVGEDFMPGRTRIPASSRSYNCTYPDYATTYILYQIVALGTDNSNGSSVMGTYSDQLLIYVSAGEPPEPVPPPEPTTPAAGRLEQFQNREGVNIYPRTILEGIFRQSDGKSLEELLAALADNALDIELPLSIENGGTGASTAEDGLAALIDQSINDNVPPTAYTNVYLPISVNGKCHKIPFTKIQKWTVGDRGSAVNQDNAQYTSFIARGIAAGTTDYIAGTTAMTNGTIYVVYE